MEAEVAMNNGNHNGATAQPSTVRYRKLLSRKSHFGLKNADIAKAAGVCEVTVSRFLNGDEAIRPEIQNAITRVLKLRRIVDFEPIETDRGFAQMIGDPGLKFFIRYEMSRNCWAVIQESPLGAHEVGAFHGVETERMARFCAEQLNNALGAR